MLLLGKRRRGKVTETDVATLKRYRCGSHALVYVKSKFDLPNRWLVVKCGVVGEYVVSRHRLRTAAVKQLIKLVA